MSKLASTFDIGEIHVIESIPLAETQTGKKLFDELRLWKEVYQPPVTVEYHNINTINEFLLFLNRLAQNIKKIGKLPLLHIEAHGNSDGLGLPSGELIKWSLLTEPFTTINIAARNNLVVIVSACFGMHVMKTLRIVDRSPIFGLVGYPESINAGEVEQGYQNFYHELFRTKDINHALETLNKGRSDAAAKRFHIYTAQLLFYAACGDYIRIYTTPNALKERAQKLFDQLKAHPRTKNVPEEKLKTILKSTLEIDHMTHLESIYNHFMMVDIYPENSSRFIFDPKKVEFYITHPMSVK